MTNDSFTKKTEKNHHVLGERLKNLRKKNSMSLDDLSESTKIQKRYLDYLEKGLYGKLPSRVYISGFISRYAKVFGEDPKPYLNQYDIEVGFQPVEQITLENKSINRMPRVIITPRLIFVLSGLSVFLMVVSYFAYQLSFLMGVPSLAVISPAEADLVTDRETILLEGEVDFGADLNVNNQRVYADQSGKFKVELELKDGLNVIEVNAKNVLGKNSSIIKRVVRE